MNTKLLEKKLEWAKRNPSTYVKCGKYWLLYSQREECVFVVSGNGDYVTVDPNIDAVIEVYNREG